MFASFAIFPINPKTPWNPSPFWTTFPFFFPLLETETEMAPFDWLKCSPGVSKQNLVLCVERTEVKLDISATSRLFLTLCPLLMFEILSKQVDLWPFTPALNPTAWRRHVLHCLAVRCRAYNQTLILILTWYQRNEYQVHICSFVCYSIACSLLIFLTGIH